MFGIDCANALETANGKLWLWHSHLLRIHLENTMASVVFLFVVSYNGLPQCTYRSILSIEDGCWRIVCWSSISTTHCVFSSSSAMRRREENMKNRNQDCDEEKKNTFVQQSNRWVHLERSDDQTIENKFSKLKSSCGLFVVRKIYLGLCTTTTKLYLLGHPIGVFVPVNHVVHSVARSRALDRDSIKFLAQ